MISAVMSAGSVHLRNGWILRKDGKIDAETKEKIPKLNDKWKRDPDPISNAKVKKRN